ncbi:Sigma-70, region 4 [Lentzea albida]|uniref:RNA polymerase sigma-70 factor, ECF subfamily n=2 Tax=Lentzea TaxID=165301 RepID=A0A1G7WJ34_9PSEU|nr:RNA polymerase sigma-70 factor, ECF subfamily [Lentzea fradiae]SES43229.1 Sigma-70, region 4 [Lentzea albida]
MLSPEQRAVLELRVVRGLTAEQAASALGSTAAAVRLLQHHALDALRNAITREGTRE